MRQRRQVGKHGRGRLVRLRAGNRGDAPLELCDVEAPLRRVALQRFEQQLSVCVAQPHAAQPVWSTFTAVP